MKDRITEEVEAKLSLILRNRDDLLRRIESSEKEHEKLSMDLS